jgi:hypothetical protein
MGDEDDDKWVSGRYQTLRNALHAASLYVDKRDPLYDEDEWQGAPIGTVAINLPPIVLLNALQSVLEGQVESPGILRHEGGEVARARNATETTTTRLDKNTRRPIMDKVRY